LQLSWPPLTCKATCTRSLRIRTTAHLLYGVSAAVTCENTAPKPQLSEAWPATLPYEQGNQLHGSEVTSMDLDLPDERHAVAELDLLPYDEYVARLPRKVMSAGALIRDVQGRVLLLEPAYKAYWDIPGGTVDGDEAPWATAAREVSEEIGLDRPVGRLLVVDHVPHEDGGLPERVAFVFDGGNVSENDLAGLVLSPEIVNFALHPADALRAMVKSTLAERILAAIDAADSGITALCEHGKRVS
jgi:8-oxo-dGTP pyrophosphatase MutT (NUDIX family)